MIRNMEVLDIKCDNEAIIEKIQSNIYKLTEETARQNEQIKTLFNQQSNMNKLIENVITLTQEIKFLRSNVDDIRKEVSDIKINKIKTYDHYKTIIISCIITGVISFIIGRILV